MTAKKSKKASKSTFFALETESRRSQDGVRKESGRMSELKMAKNTMFVTTKAREIKQNLRPIVIDGSNVAMSHGRNKFFSCRGIEMVSEHFTKLGHKTIAFVPQFRNLAGRVKDPKVIKVYVQMQVLV